MRKYEFKIDLSSSVVKISISGNIDENATFQEFDMTGKSQIEIDFNQVYSINSLGARSWITWLKKISQYKIQFVNCPKVLIDQINMISSLLPANAKIVSFYVPYFNEDSGEEKYVLFRQGREFSDSRVTPPKDITDQYNKPMEIGIIESRYFKFLKSK